MTVRDVKNVQASVRFETYGAGADKKLFKDLLSKYNYKE